MVAYPIDGDSGYSVVLISHPRCREHSKFLLFKRTEIEVGIQFSLIFLTEKG